MHPDIDIAGKQYFSRPTLAKTLGKASTTLANWRTRGVGPRMVRVGGTPLYPADGVFQWLGEGK